jgi:TATA-binding protein-associated factor Taf7
MATAPPNTPQPAAEPKGTKDDDKDSGTGAHNANVDELADSKGQARDNLENAHRNHAMVVKPQLPAKAQGAIGLVSSAHGDQKKMEGSLENIPEGDLDEMKKEYHILRGELDELWKLVRDRRRQVDSLRNRIHRMDSDVHNLTTEMEELKGQV